jgi:tRNA G26 N,N-dimethylase Trm1
MFETIINEVVDNHLKQKEMLKEYCNPQSSERIRTCADELEKVYYDTISQGASKHEITLVRLSKIVEELRKLEKKFS